MPGRNERRAKLRKNEDERQDSRRLQEGRIPFQPRDDSFAHARCAISRSVVAQCGNRFMEGVQSDLIGNNRHGKEEARARDDWLELPTGRLPVPLQRLIVEVQWLMKEISRLPIEFDQPGEQGTGGLSRLKHVIGTVEGGALFAQ